MTGLAVSNQGEIELDVNSVGDEFEVTYEMPGPVAVETVVNSTSKQLTISSDIDYKDVKSYIDIEDTFYDNIKLYHQPYGEKLKYIKAEDRNNNGMFDRVVWITPHLSTEVYEVNVNPLNSTEKVVIMLKDGVKIDDFLNTVGQGFDLGYRYSIFNGVSATVTRENLLALKSNVNIKGIYKDFIAQVDMQDSVPLINATQVHNTQINGFNITGGSQTVCVVDTGVDAGHPALLNRVVKQYCFCNGCCADGSSEQNNNATDDYGHGTHVAGTVAGSSTITGVAPGANIAAAKVCNSGGSCATADMIKGFEFCVSNSSLYNISVITMSIGSSTLYSDITTCESASAGFLAAVNNATINNIFISAATGNSYSKTGISWPACIGNITSVGATNKSDTMADFGNRNALTDVVAPGVSINSSVPVGSCAMCAASRYGVASGTSMATPHVAGAAALLQQYSKQKNNLNLTPDEVRYLLKTTGKIVNDNLYGSDSQLSFPRINPLNAINAMFTVNKTINMTSNQFGNITFSDPNNLSNIQRCVNISKNFISVDSAVCPQLNKSAKIVLNTYNFNSTPIVLSNGIVCPNTICNVLNYANNNLTFNVTKFSEYSAAKNSNLTIWTEVDPGFVYGGLTRYVGEQVYIFANYTNATNNSLISIGSCNVSFSDASGNFVINATKNLFEFNRTFSLANINNYTVNCNSTAYENLTLSSSFTINPYEATVCSSGCAYTNLTLALISNNNTENTTITLNQGNATFNITSSAIYNISIRGNFPAIKFNTSDQLLDCSKSGIINYNGNGYGLYAANMNNITAINCNLTGYYHGIKFLNGIGMNLTNNFVNNSQSHGVNLTTTNISINLNTINNSLGYSIYSLDSNIVSLSVLTTGNTLANSSLGKLIVDWFLQVRVINNTNNITNADVQIFELGNSTRQYKFSTNATGLIAPVPATQFLIYNNGTQSNKTSHTLWGNKTTVGRQEISLAITSSRVQPNEVKLNLSNCLILGNDPPIGFINSYTLCSGTYYLKLEGLEGSNLITLDAENVSITCDGTKIYDLIPQSSYMFYSTKKNVTLKSCELHDALAGIFFVGSDNSLIYNNTLYNSSLTVSLSLGTNVINNTMYYSYMQVGPSNILTTSNNILIQGNGFFNTTTNIYLQMKNSIMRNNTISNLTSSSGVYVLWIPAGDASGNDFTINNTIANNTFIGDARVNTESGGFLTSSGNNTIAGNIINGTLSLNDFGNNATNNIIKGGNLSIYGGNAINNTIINGSILLQAGYPSTLINNTINDSRSFGISISAANSIIDRNIIFNTSDKGITVSQAGINITNNNLNYTKGIFITGDNQSLINNTIWNTTGAGINLSGKNMLINLNKIVNSSGYGVQIRTTSLGVNITNNNLTNTEGIGVTGSNQSLLNNTIWNSTNYGIYLLSTTNTTVINNTICHTKNITIYRSPLSTHNPNATLDMLNNNTFCNGTINRYEQYWSYNVLVVDSNSVELSNVLVDLYEYNMSNIWKSKTTGANGRTSFASDGEFARQFYINGSGSQINATPHTINAQHISTGLTKSTAVNITSNDLETTISLNLISSPGSSSPGSSSGSGGGGGGGGGNSTISEGVGILIYMPKEIIAEKGQKEGPITEKPLVFDTGLFDLSVGYSSESLDSLSVTKTKDKIILFLNKDKWVYSSNGGEYKFNLNWGPSSKLIEVSYIDILLYIIAILSLLILFIGISFVNDYLKRNRKI